MKTIFLLALTTLVFLLLSPSAFAYVKVRGFYRSSGKYVQTYYRTNKNAFKFDNWSSKGNTNPFTGKKGYKKF